MTHIMVDIETLSTKKNALILTLAARVFTFCSTTEDSIYLKIDSTDYNNYPSKFDTDPATILWWSRQDESVRKEAFSGSLKLLEAMKEFNKFVQKQKPPYYIWSHGKEFDIPILEHAFNVLNLNIPWRFWDTRDTRTVYHLASIDLKNIIIDGDAHNAKDDVRRQILGINQACKILNLNLI